MPSVNITISLFPELSLETIYAILRLRSEVFVKEQACAYQDVDGKDQDAVHIVGMKQNQVVAYARVHFGYENVISRVVVSPKYRGQRLGDEIVKMSIEFIKEKNDNQILISAQEHLVDWYKSFGFKQVGGLFLEDGIPHQKMILKMNKILSITK